ncbi:hypothetical protein [Actinocrispum sp. NPDC049592]|uniref:hypothetical protein n=1 Tax=Actinocrispum sp. NPDC049592 TaxID=3154835 RepID=UPI0034437BCA
MKTNARIRKMLGRDLLAELEHHLHPLDCQTCGGPFRGREPTLAVHSEGELTTVALHHRKCLKPGCYGPLQTSLHKSWRCSALLLEEQSPVFFVVNPSCETVQIETTGNGWRITSLDMYWNSGLSATLVPSVMPPETLIATLDGKRLTVTFTPVGTSLPFTWAVGGLGERTMKAIDSYATIAVVVTTALNGGPVRGLRDVTEPIAKGWAASGMARVHFTPETQRLRFTDFDPNTIADLFGVLKGIIKNRLGVELEDRPALAAFATCDGKYDMLPLLSGMDRYLSMLLVASVYAPSKTKGTPGEGVHIVMPDQEVDTVVKMFQTVFADLDGFATGRLPDDYATADIAIGTLDQYNACPTGRGRLLITDRVTVTAEQRAPYRRVVDI